MKIYTKTGDDGSTGLFGGERVSKTHARIEAIGTVDELNAALGVALSHAASSLAGDGAWQAIVRKVQSDLFTLGAELATPTAKKSLAELSANLTQADTRALEQAIDHFDTSLPPLKQFILPGGSTTAASLHLARAVCRRAERRVLALHELSPQAPLRDELVIYLNRLSDFLFVLARAVNQGQGVPDVPWQPPRG
jgi:cob(I)alamin adenosyltransferase